MTAVVIADGRQLRWPGVVLLFVVAAAVLFLEAVQFGAWARQHSVNPDDFRTWFDDADEAGEDHRGYYVLELARQDRVYYIHAQRARFAYGSGVMLLLLALGGAAAPPADAEQPALRWMATGIACLAALLEAGWMFIASIGPERRTSLIPLLHRLVEGAVPRA